MSDDFKKPTIDISHPLAWILPIIIFMVIGYAIISNLDAAMRSSQCPSDSPKHGRCMRDQGHKGSHAKWYKYDPDFWEDK